MNLYKTFYHAFHPKMIKIVKRGLWILTSMRVTRINPHAIPTSSASYAPIVTTGKTREKRINARSDIQLASPWSNEMPLV